MYILLNKIYIFPKWGFHYLCFGPEQQKLHTLIEMELNYNLVHVSVD